MNVIEQYFHVVLFIMLHKVVLTFTFVDEILFCGQTSDFYVCQTRITYEFV